MCALGSARACMWFGCGLIMCVRARPALSVFLESCCVLMPIIRLEAIKAALIIIARLRNVSYTLRLHATKPARTEEWPTPALGLTVRFNALCSHGPKSYHAVDLMRSQLVAVSFYFEKMSSGFI